MLGQHRSISFLFHSSHPTPFQSWRINPHKSQWLPNPSPSNSAVVTGGGGGIDKAIPEYLISIGKKLTIVGRTEKSLAQTAQELGHNTTYYVLDTGNISAIHEFVKSVIKEHPEVDCLIKNAGVQRTTC
jgi:NADP-dependent 3-hydroxy acid dehydrogenase YdfG